MLGSRLPSLGFLFIALTLKKRAMSYRNRLTSIRDIADRETPAARDQHGNIVTDPDACRELLFAVLESALRDHAFLRDLESRKRVSKPQARRRAAIIEVGDPADFFDGPWFEDICHFLSLQPDSVRDLLAETGSDSKLAQAS